MSTIEILRGMLADFTLKQEVRWQVCLDAEKAEAVEVARINLANTPEVGKSTLASTMDGLTRESAQKRVQEAEAAAAPFTVDLVFQRMPSDEWRRFRDDFSITLEALESPMEQNNAAGDHMIDIARRTYRFTEFQDEKTEIAFDELLPALTNGDFEILANELITFHSLPVGRGPLLRL